MPAGLALARAVICSFPHQAIGIRTFIGCPLCLAPRNGDEPEPEPPAKRPQLFCASDRYGGLPTDASTVSIWLRIYTYIYIYLLLLSPVGFIGILSLLDIYFFPGDLSKWRTSVVSMPVPNLERVFQAPTRKPPHRRLRFWAARSPRHPPPRHLHAGRSDLA